MTQQKYIYIHNTKLTLIALSEWKINWWDLLEAPSKFDKFQKYSYGIFGEKYLSCFFFIFAPPFFVLKNFRKWVSVAFVNGRLEAFFFSGGVRLIVRIIRWILVHFRCRRRRSMCKSIWIGNLYGAYGSSICMPIRIANLYGHTNFIFVIVKLVFNN